MRPLLTALILALSAGPAGSGEAGPAESVLAQQRSGGFAGTARSSVQGGAVQGNAAQTPVPGAAGPTPIPRTTPPGAAALRRDLQPPGEKRPRDQAEHEPPPEKPPGKPPRRPRDPFLFFDDDDFDDEDRIIVVPVPRPEPEEEPEQAAPAEPPPPPDPRGPKFVPARGAANEARYTVGEALPKGVPFVTLDWKQYALPEPPRGLIYARVGGDVLLIDPATRMVERRVDPSELQAAEGAPGSG